MGFGLKALIERDTPLRRVCSRDGGEYAGPCPFCRLGADRFHVWEGAERWACLGPEAGRAGCGIGGDAVDYLRRRDDLSYAEACAALGVPESVRARAQSLDATAPSAPLRLCVEPASPPGETWQARGRDLVARCRTHLWDPEGRRALDYLHARGLGDEVLQAHAAGYLGGDVRERRALWGLPEEERRPDGTVAPAKPIWLPRGIVLPWSIGGALWRINIRRPISARQAAAGQPKYIGPAGFANALYNADALGARRPVALVEGEIDALTIAQEAGDLLAAVATGSTAGGRRSPWVERLAAAPFVLVAFDCDPNGAGEQAARWWLGALPNALRWRPLLHDANTMQVRGVGVRGWVAGGIEHAIKSNARLRGRTGITS